MLLDNTPCDSLCNAPNPPSPKRHSMQLYYTNAQPLGLLILHPCTAAFHSSQPYLTHVPSPPSPRILAYASLHSTVPPFSSFVPAAAAAVAASPAGGLACTWTISCKEGGSINCGHKSLFKAALKHNSAFPNRLH